MNGREKVFMFMVFLSVALMVVNAYYQQMIGFIIYFMSAVVYLTVLTYNVVHRWFREELQFLKKEWLQIYLKKKNEELNQK